MSRNLRMIPKLKASNLTIAMLGWFGKPRHECFHNLMSSRSPRDLPAPVIVRKLEKSGFGEKENLTPDNVGCSDGVSPSSKLLKPISTERLKPHVEKSKKALVRILENGEVRVEFFKISAGVEFVMEVMRISSNGKKIGIYQMGPGTVVNREVPAGLESAERRYYSLMDLPENYHKKYTFAAKVLDLVRAATPKITLYTGNSKAVLKENGDFELNIAKYDRGKYEKGSFRHGHCQSIEHALEALASNENPCFPVIIGRDSIGGANMTRTPRTPNSEAVLNESSKENTPQLPPAARRPLSESRSNLMDKEQRRTVKKYVPEYDCTVEEEGDDGSCKLKFHSTEEVLRLGRDGYLTFRGPGGKDLRYHMKNKDSLPSDIKRKLKILNDILSSLGASSLIS